jgi:hypothetical protein
MLMPMTCHHLLKTLLQRMVTLIPCMVPMLLLNKCINSSYKPGFSRMQLLDIIMGISMVCNTRRFSM